MATQTKTAPAAAPTIADFEKNAELFNEVSAKAVEAGKKLAAVQLDAYERTALAVADFDEQIASATQSEWLSELATTRAGLTREVTKVYTTTARELLNK